MKLNLELDLVVILSLIV